MLSETFQRVVIQRFKTV